jgi:hypothetical protein
VSTNWIFLVAVLVLVVGCGQGYVKQTENFAAQVKSRVNPDELQSWATNLIAKTPAPSLNQFRGVKETDVPNYVRAIYKDDPPEEVVIYHGDGGSYVQIIYGSGFGHWGLYVGLTGLEMKSDERFYVVQWKPGVYFWNGP